MNGRPVHGTPRQTGEGQVIFFTDGDRVHAFAPITSVEEGKYGSRHFSRTINR